MSGDATLLVTALSNLLGQCGVLLSQPGSPVSVSRRLVDGLVEIAVDRPRHRDRARAPGARVRAVLPHRSGAQPLHRRHRAGPGDRQARRRQPRRRRPALEQTRHRLHLHPADSRATRTVHADAHHLAVHRHRTRARGRSRHDQGADRRGRGSLRRPAGLLAAQGGLRDRGGRQRVRGARGVRPQRCRHRAARPDAARA